MKKGSKVLLVTLALAIISLVGTVLVGGLHHSTFIRFAPVGEAEFQSDIDFVPDLSVTYFGGQYNRAFIPFILYTHGRKNGEGYVAIQTEHENDPRYGYDALSHIELTNLTVVGKEKEESLITENSPLRVNLNTERWASRSKKLGRVEEDEIEFIVTGTAHTKEGQSHDFSYKRKWRKVTSSRWDIGLGLMP